MPVKAGAKTSHGALVALWSASLALGLAGCGPQAGAQNGAMGGAMPPPEVGVVEIAAAPLEQTVTLSGRVSAYLISEVRPQIGGIVRARRFTEGANVSTGQLLYEIDPGPARASLSSAQATAEAARVRYERYQGLVSIGAISQQDLDDARAAADQAAGALENARISENYTRVTAPISGVIGASSVTPGALAVPAQAEPFAVIQQIDRVYIDMTMSSGEFLRLRQSLQGRGDAIRVRVTLQDGAEYGRDGVLQFSDVTIQEATGAVQLRALLPNPDRILLPGMFVNAKVVLGIDEDAILAPQQGVSRNARGEPVALVLNAENMVEERVLETAGAADGNWIVVSGLNPGDRMIIEGAQRVRPGAPAPGVAPTPAPAQPTQEGRLRDSELRGRG